MNFVAFSANPNIQPVEEYENACRRRIKPPHIFPCRSTPEAYDPASWETAVKDLTETPEGGARCEQCFLLRLRRTAQFCASIHWPGFTTVMSISPHKKIDMAELKPEPGGRGIQCCVWVIQF